MGVGRGPELGRKCAKSLSGHDSQANYVQEVEKQAQVEVCGLPMGENLPPPAFAISCVYTALESTAGQYQDTPRDSA